MTTWTVYEHVGRDETVLYVGCTSDLKRRTHDHVAYSPWWRDVVETRVLRELPDRAEALELERQLIGELDPPANIIGTERPWRVGYAQPVKKIKRPREDATELPDGVWVHFRTGTVMHRLIDREHTACGLQRDWRQAFLAHPDALLPCCATCERMSSEMAVAS